MKTVLIEPFGYSTTIRKVLDVSYQARQENPNAEIIMLGGILNGNIIDNHLSALGIKNIVIPPIGFYDYVKQLNENVVLITSPYGTRKEVIKLLDKRKIKYYDATSPTIVEKRDFILNNCKSKNIIYIGNINTIEADYLAESTNHKYHFYDISSNSSKNNRIFNKRYNKEKTIIIFQSDLPDDVLTRTLRKITAFLPKAIINKNISDENYKKKKIISENLDNGDLLLNISSFYKPTRYLLDYYRIANKKVYFATISSVYEAIYLNIDHVNKVVIVSDGTVSKNVILEIYTYFYYRSIQVKLHDSKIKFQVIDR